jgi:phosphohistidine phosphatase SixA
MVSTLLLCGTTLVAALREGGHVVVMRHASSLYGRPETTATEPENSGRERELDDAGQTFARVLGETLRTLRIPFGEVFTSPSYRARQTVRLVGLAHPQSVIELDESPEGLQANTIECAAWLHATTTRYPSRGCNTLVVTHTPNLVDAFCELGSKLAPGEALVFRPNQRGGTDLVAHIKIRDWKRLASI